MKALRRPVRTTLLALAAFALPACAAEYSLDLKPADTKVRFSVDSTLHTVHGTFALKSGEIVFDTVSGKASGRVVVDVASGSSDSDARDSRMHAVVLESKKFPEAVFVPDRIDGQLAIPGSSAVKLHGVFTLHGAPHEMTIDVQTSGTRGQFHAALDFDIPYVAWGLKDPGNFMLKVNKIVKMSIETTGALEMR